MAAHRVHELGLKKEVLTTEENLEQGAPPGSFLNPLKAHLDLELNLEGGVSQLPQLTPEEEVVLVQGTE